MVGLRFLPRLSLFLLCGCASHLAGNSPKIMGYDSIPAGRLEHFLLEKNPQLDPVYVDELVAPYRQECQEEEIRLSGAYAQMCLETNYLKFSRKVKSWQNNFCGFGAGSRFSSGDSFPDMRTGIRVHVQHLRAYASRRPTHNPCIDSRRRLVRLGSSPRVSGLSMRWAGADPDYGFKICRIMEQL
jgi:hypothetical protein